MNKKSKIRRWAICFTTKSVKQHWRSQCVTSFPGSFIFKSALENI